MGNLFQLFKQIFAVHRKYFTLDEFIYTSKVPYGHNVPSESNESTPYVYFNLYLLSGLLESLRTYLQMPIIISSGYRTAKVNYLVGGVANSKHMRGLAVDFVVDYDNPKILCDIIIPSLLEDYCISNLHLSFVPSHYVYYNEKKNYYHLEIDFDYNIKQSKLYTYG